MKGETEPETHRIPEQEERNNLKAKMRIMSFLGGDLAIRVARHFTVGILGKGLAQWW